MTSRLREHWRCVKEGEPGRRFQDLHDLRQEDRGSPWAFVLWVALGIALVLAAPVVGLVPGPGGLVLLLLGTALLGREMRPAARLLDRCELFLRRSWKRMRG